MAARDAEAVFRLEIHLRERVDVPAPGFPVARPAHRGERDGWQVETYAHVEVEEAQRAQSQAGAHAVVLGARTQVGRLLDVAAGYEDARATLEVGQLQREIQVERLVEIELAVAMYQFRGDTDTERLHRNR